jgi:hypothetical protein
MSDEPDDDLTPDEAFEKLMKTCVTLSKVDTSKPRPWTRGMPGYMRPGRALWFGPRGCGKSLAALTACVDVVAAGGRAVYIDVENGAPRMAERMECILKCRPDDVRAAMADDFIYFDGFDFALLEDPVVLKEMSGFLGDVDLLVIDSLPRIFAQLNLNENEPSHCTRLVVKYIDPLVGTGASALALDNTGHTVKHRPRGGSPKEDTFELCYLVAGGQTCSKEDHGTITLVRKRKRDGDEFLNLSLGFGGGDYGSIVADDSGAQLLDSILSLLSSPQSKNWIATKAKAAGIQVGRARLLKLLDQWSEDPDSGIMETTDGKFGPLDG